MNKTNSIKENLYLTLPNQTLLPENLKQFLNATMNENTTIKFNSNTFLSAQLIYRLIAIWVISEAVAGGIIHGLHLPFSGIIISGFAVVCICLIGFVSIYQNINEESINTKKKSFFLFEGSILKATIIVCIFKMMLSPQSPPTAYFAVLFQGVVGQILFSKKNNFKISCMILGCLALVESAIQRILVLIILYGTDFWLAVNEFIKRTLGQKEMNNYALFLAFLYVLIHAILGIYIGLKAANLVNKTKYWQQTHQQFLIHDLEKLELSPQKKAKKKHLKKIFLILWIILILLFFQSVFKIGTPVLSQNKALIVLFRSILIVLTWYLVLSPLLIVWIKKKLKNQEEKSKSEITKILELLPNVEKIFRKSWQLSATQKNIKRISLFWKILWINTLTIKN